MTTQQHWQDSTGDLFRDLGMDRVAVNNVVWANDLHHFVTRYFRTAPGVFAWEDVRNFAEDFGLRQPSHKNAWGASIRSYLSQLEEVGQRKSRRPEAHSRLTRTYTLKEDTNGL